MVGITLTPEQIRSAPPDVRHWLEQELATSLALRPRQPEREEPRHDHLVACTVEEVTAITTRDSGDAPRGQRVLRAWPPWCELCR